MTDTDFLKRAVRLARESSEAQGCGTVLVQDSQVIAEAYNSQTTDQQAINHAEIKAIVAANTKLQSKKLPNTVAYCSCEPCAMCLAALSYAKVERIVFDKRMKDVFPGDKQAAFDSFSFVQTLNFVPKLQQILL